MLGGRNYRVDDELCVTKCLRETEKYAPNALVMKKPFFINNPMCGSLKFTLISTWLPHPHAIIRRNAVVLLYTLEESAMGIVSKAEFRNAYRNRRPY